MVRLYLFRALIAFFFALSLFVQSLSAQVRGTIVGPGAERYPIAVSLLRNLGRAKMGADFRKG